MEVYRYISFNTLKEVVEKKRLYFVNPFVKWSDTKEGSLYRIAQDISKLDKHNDILSGYKYKEQIIKQLQNGGIVANENNEGILDWFGMRCQSWSKSRNSLKMWNRYSYNNCAVCIAVDTSKLLSLHSQNQKVYGFDVQYKSEINISEEIQQAIGRNGEFYFPFILQTKQKNLFEFENEYRLYILQLNSQGHFIGENHDSVYVSIDYEIDEFIDEVFVHPNASEDYVKSIRKYVENFNINFSEK